MNSENLITTVEKKITEGDVRLGVIGMGYVGLSLACEFAGAGIKVLGFEIDEARVKQLHAGRSYVRDVTDEELARCREAGTLDATLDFSRLGEVDAISICVPTPLRKSKDPDISFVIEASRRIAEALKPGHVIVLESTTYPGTTEEVIRPALEEGGLRAGEDFFLAFSPERVDPGNERFGTKNTPKVVGGITEDCTRIAAALYSRVIEHVVQVSSPSCAEMVKLLENTFRIVNIGLVNEIAIMCDRLDLNVWEVIDAAATKPFGFMPFYPGPGLGGHCIPIDPHYLAWKLRTLDYRARFIELAGEISSEMPEYVVGKVVDALNDRCRSLKGSRVLVVGAAYKRDTNDCRESPALDILRILKSKGADVAYHDPYVHELSLGDWSLESVDLTTEEVKRADCSVIVTDHSKLDIAGLVESSEVVVDTRNATKGLADRSKVVLL